MKPTFFRTRAAFRAWLEAHHADRTELLVGFYKKGARKKGMTYPESVEEALCFGWIDGVRRTLDEERYEQRFTPRKPRSNWSNVNIGHVERLVREGLMRPPGMAAFEARTGARTGVYSFEQPKPVELDRARMAKLRANRAAWGFFSTQAPSYQRVAVFWVMSAKQDSTRDRRLAQLAECSAKGEVAPPFRYSSSAKRTRAKRRVTSRRP